MPTDPVQNPTEWPRGLDERSYWWGVLIGLQAAAALVTRGGGAGDIEAQAADVKRHAARGLPSAAADAEWRSWMVELEMQAWERSRAA